MQNGEDEEGGRGGGRDGRRGGEEGGRVEGGRGGGEEGRREGGDGHVIIHAKCTPSLMQRLTHDTHIHCDCP